MSSKMDNRVNNSRGISYKKNKRQLSPREKLEIKKKLRRKEKKSTVIKRAIKAACLTILILIVLGGIYLFSFIAFSISFVYTSLSINPSSCAFDFLIPNTTGLILVDLEFFTLISSFNIYNQIEFEHHTAS